MVQIQCPQCGSAMHEEDHGETIDRCLSCGGLWFDADELRAALKRPSSARLATDPATVGTVVENATLHCPRCQGSKLSGRRDHNVQVEFCQNCRGVFVSPKAFLTILDRKSYGGGDVALDVLIVAPEIPAAALEGVLEILADVFSVW